MNKWYNKTGPQGDVVISTRIRFARNLNSFPFPCKLSEKQKVEVINLVKNVISEDEIEKELKYVDLRSLSKVDRVSLVERHITSPNFVEETYGRGLFLSDDESVSVMINEEDHIRLQVIKPGLTFEESIKNFLLRLTITWGTLRNALQTLEQG